MSKVALITGITGQDGSYLSELLLAKNYKVHGFIRFNNNIKNFKKLWRIKDIIKKIKLHKVDFNNREKLKFIVNKINPDEIYHLAAQAYDGHSFKNKNYTLNVNFDYTHNLLSSLNKNNKKVRFFFAGSSEMYDKNPKQKINENTPFNPKSAYGIAKVASYYLIKNYRDNYRLNASTGILFNHESPRKDDQFVLRKISKSVAKIKLGKQKKIKLGNIKSKRDWGHAKDFVKAMWLINQQKQPADYIVGTGKLYNVEDFLKRAFRYVNLDYKKYLVIDKKLFRKKESNARLADPRKIQKKLRWIRKFNFNSLVKDMIENDIKIIKKKYEKN